MMDTSNMSLPNSSEDPFSDGAFTRETSLNGSRRASAARSQTAGSRSRRGSIKRVVAGTKSALRQKKVPTASLRPRNWRPKHARFEDNGDSPDQRNGNGNGSSNEKQHQGNEDEFRAELEAYLPAKLSFKERMRHFTWTWFTMTMATGGIANVLYSIPHELRFDSLYALGCTFFLLNIALFIFNVTMISIRFYLYPHTFKQSFLHPTESLFIPAAVISVGTILINITQYGVGYAGPWLERAIVPLYWIYCGLAVLSSWGIFLTIWSTQTFTIAKMTPVWIFPAYPLLIVGPHAGNLARKLSPEKGLPIIVGGFILQGIGFMVSLMVYSAFLYRLMTQKLPKESLRPAMFISVGPSGFTITAFVQMGQELPRVVNKDFMGAGLGDFAAKVTMVLANWAGMWLWGLAIWLFLISVGAHFSCAARGKMDFAMTWYSFVFPNTALTTATFSVSYALHGNLTEAPGFSRGARPFQILGLIMTVGIIVVWFFVFFMMIRAVILKQILWPQKQEDRDEGGWGKDEILRKGELRSVFPSRQLSHIGSGAMGSTMPHLLVTPAGEGLGEGIAAHPSQPLEALAESDATVERQRDNIESPDGQQIDVQADEEGLYMTMSGVETEDKKSIDEKQEA
ncbi:uncharacterized protein PV09_00968 [Verruconis gallopava]|uniref:C4-dicarboxylate transporter/malic acid transporter n=1 Tax=Verruconis gallopava TaxID=253628 RepID=A0A0D2AMV8_9PEZI|nr:uncharacterized protein PV09_00968 [Verruconis gallopava]KIW08023.1 hypothetical protein PV09_00968 [Verruconis gallopava]